MELGSLHNSLRIKIFLTYWSALDRALYLEIAVSTCDHMSAAYHEASSELTYEVMHDRDQILYSVDIIT